MAPRSLAPTAASGYGSQMPPTPPANACARSLAAVTPPAKARPFVGRCHPARQIDEP